jgi:hypothetical protein
MKERMSKREIIARQLDRLTGRDLDRLLAFLRAIHEANADAAGPMLAAEAALVKDWLSPEEDSVWAGL